MEPPPLDRRRFLAAGALSTGAIAAAAPARRAALPPLERPGADAFAGWTERARISAYGQDWRVLEDLRVRDGALAFVAADGRALVLPKRLEPVAGHGAAPYLGLKLEEVALADADLLADRLLASGDDPDEVQVRDAAPPPASDFKPDHVGARLVWTFFAGTRQQADTMPVNVRGATRTDHVEQVFPALLSDEALVARRHEGLLGGETPAIVKVFPIDERRHYEMVVFGDVEARDRFIVQTWRRACLVEDGKVTKTAYAYSYVPYPPARVEPDPASFYLALLAFAVEWRGELLDMSPLALPDPSWRDLTRHAFVKEVMTRPDGVYPKYGAVDRDYYGSEYDGFQDTFTSSLYANLEWGRFDQARAVLDNYFTDFVAPDGMVNMRGPETAQFGLTLSLLTRYLRYTGDRTTLQRHAGKIAATARILTDLHDIALRLPASDPGHGLISGWSESDSSLFPTPMVWWKPYFSNSAFAARGLREIAAVWPLLQPGATPLARDWTARADRLQARVTEAVRASVRHDLTPPYVPPLPGVELTFRQSLAAEHPSPQGWPHRAYAELVHADVLPPDLANTVIDAMRGHGATTLGVVANVGRASGKRRDILGFISYGYARQLLKLDRVEEYLLFLYAHRHHAHTAGSWTAGEVCDITGGLPLFCIPAQLTIPLLMRWMLAFEDDDADRLWLGRAVPRAWLASGKPLSIENAPTRWGRVDLSLQADPQGRRVHGRVALRCASRPQELHLRLRTPKGWRLRSVSVNGSPAEVRGDTVRLDTAKAAAFEVVATYA